MSDKRVPEDNDRSRQIAELLTMLLGHKAFGRLRGKGGIGLAETVKTLINIGVTPTGYCREWDRYAADARVVGNLIATLQRDGKTHAVEAMLHALSNPAYTFPGEVIPLHETTPITLTMFEPDRTLTMLKWIMRGHFSELDDYIHDRGAIHEERFGLVEALFAAFPSLEPAARQRRRQGDYEGWDVAYAMQVDILRTFQITNEFKPMHLAYGQYNDHLELSPPRMSSRQVTVNPNIGQVDCLAYFAYWIAGDQEEVLSHFNRKDQDRIATWQFHVHPIMAEKSLIQIGLHSEEEHGQWMHEYTTQASKGCANSMGGFFCPPTDYKTLIQQHPAERAFHVVLQGNLS